MARYASGPEACERRMYLLVSMLKSCQRCVRADVFVAWKKTAAVELEELDREPTSDCFGKRGMVI